MQALLPDFRFTLTTAPAARPYSALNPLVCTLISLIASTDGPTAYEVWFKKSIVLTLLSTPFSRKLFWPLPRTPPAEKPPLAESRAPGSAGNTPGDSRARYAKLRCPPSGTSVSVFELMFAPTCVLSVCSRGAAAVTSTVWPTSPTLSVMSTPVRSPAFSRMSFCSAVRNPGALTATLYVDGFSAGRTKSPVRWSAGCRPGRCRLR